MLMCRLIGPDRYMKIAAKLDRSLDEIFPKATELRDMVQQDDEKTRPGKRLPEWLLNL